MAILRQFGLASSSACPASVRDDLPAFPNSAVRWGVNCLDASSIYASKHPARQLVLNSIPNISSHGAVCKKNEQELHVSVVPNSATLAVGVGKNERTCDLLAVVAKKVDLSLEPKVHMRFDFHNCTGGPPTASVVMALKPVPENQVTQSMLPFWMETCGPKPETHDVKAVNMELKFNQVDLGQGLCDGMALKSIFNVTAAACAQLCMANVQMYATSVEALKDTPDACKGYSFQQIDNATTKCEMFKAKDGKEITASLPETSLPQLPKTSTATCTGLVARASSDLLSKSTVAPPSAEEQAALEASMPKFNVDVQASLANILTFVSPEFCYDQFDWITLEDTQGKIQEVYVKQSNWEQFLGLIPNPSVPEMNAVQTNVAAPPDEHANARRLADASLKAIIYSDRANFGVLPPTVAPPVPTLPPCKAEPAEPVNMTMTYILAALIVIAAAVGYFGGKFIGAGIGQHKAEEQKNLIP